MLRLTFHLIFAGLLVSGDPLICLAQGAGGAPRKQIIFLPGQQSHGWSGHAYGADCAILAKALNENVPGVEATIMQGGWPRNPRVLQNAAAIVIACDGNGVIGSKANYDALDQLAKKGVGVAFIHYSLDVGKENGRYLLGWIGGYYEQYWSVNPGWKADFKMLPDHPITRGVKPFAIEDEWYYHMRFVEGMKGVTAILSAVPPESTRKGPDGAHSGNAVVRSRSGMAEEVAWAYERPNAGRGFGFTGGHVHWNYANDNYRKVLLNAICWIANVDVPADGVSSTRPTADEMEANLEGARPKDWTRQRTQREIERVNQ